MTYLAQSTLKLAVIPGDGIGPEVVEQGLAVLDATLGARANIKLTNYNLGAARWHKTGETLPAAELEQLATHDAILLGAVGDPSVPAGILERGLLLKLRFAFDHYVNLRPNKIYSGVQTPLAHPGEVDFVVVREGTEGPYAGTGGTIRTGTPQEIASEVSINTAFGIERVVRYAFALAARRQRRHLTLVHKQNVLVHAGQLWERLVTKVGAEFPTVTTDYLHVDAATIFLVTNPARFDVIVTDNLFGDIITDEAAAITGGIGLAASGNINPEGTFPSMFEPIHGSAPDIARQGKADPTATIGSVGLMLSHLGYHDEAARIEAAISADLAERGGTARSTAQTGADILARL